VGSVVTVRDHLRMFWQECPLNVDPEAGLELGEKENRKLLDKGYGNKRRVENEERRLKEINP